MTMGLWIQGLRPKTLPASIAPVIAGTAAAWSVFTRSDGWGTRGRIITGSYATPWYTIDGALPRFLGMALLCMGVALFLQIAVNFANDYSDGVRGTDAHRGASETRTGKPQRLTASGLIAPKRVLAAAGISALLACLCGLGVVIVSRQYWLILVGVLCLIAGWFYTGGKHPYGYAGFGELFVFVFFGLVATLGTEFAICQSFDGFGDPDVMIFDFTQPWESVGIPGGFWQGRYGIDAVGMMASVCAGLSAVMILMVNNLRDIDDDRIHGKRTLAVRLGRRNARTVLVACAVVNWLIATVLMLIVGFGGGLVVWAGVAVIMQTMLIQAVSRRDFRTALDIAGRQCLVFSVIFVVGVLAAGDGTGMVIIR